MAAQLTLEDIGRLAGVSRSTVSRVINGQPNVNPAVRERVQDVIRRTGYAPNTAARSLVSGRSGVIGLVIPSRVHSVFEDPYFPRLIQGISAASNRTGTTLSLFLFQTEEEEEELYPRVITSGYLDGLIITATRMADPLLARVGSGDLPVVIVGRPDVEGISYVDADNRGGGVMAADHLCGLGYERIGLLGAPTSTTAGVDRTSGFVEGLARWGRTLDPHLRVDGDFTEVGGYQAMQRLIERRPEAVFVASDTMAHGALRAIRDAGLDVPGDMAIVSFDGFPQSEKSLPPLTTVHQPVTQAGMEAVHLLSQLLEGTEPPLVRILPVDLVVRESSGTGPGVARP
jgi:LacI family transcriptional regulator